ncbi:hypothetical protein [Pantanalinema sp. GBBB05]|uniref:hypothetical protein n=1 Tax=Pantanalinema sp. GBBB05 TaxID=2604139 RepID=UPI003D812748
MLTQLEEYIKSVCTSYDGTIRLIIGDAYLLTFSETPLALAALECLQTQWDRFIQQHQIPCPLSIGVHRGTMFLFRSAAYGHSINLTSQIEAMNNRLTPNIAVSSIAVSEKIQAEVIGTEWEEKLFKLEGGAFTDIHNVEHTLYQFHNDLFRILVNAMNC